MFCLLGLGSLRAQRSPIDHVQVRVGFHAKVKAAAPYTMEVLGVNGSDAPFPGQSFENHAGLTALASTPNIAVRLKPGNQYSLRISCASWKWADLQFNAPPGYTVKMGEAGHSRTARTTLRTTDYNGGAGNYQVYFTIEPNVGATWLRPGYANAPSIGNVLWSIGLGATRRGESAGVIRWRESTVTENLLDPSCLIYSEPVDSEVVVFRNVQGTIQNVSTWAVQVVVRTGSTPNSGYTIECYEPGAPQTPHTGFREYVVSNPDSTWNHRLRIDVTTRSTGNAAQIDAWTLSEQGSALQVDQTNGARRLRLVSRPGPGTDERSEIATLDAGVGSPVVSRTRRVHKMLFKSTAWEREELIQELADPKEYFNEAGVDQTNATGLDLTTSYLYFEDETKTGSFTKLKSVTRSNGGWEAFKYYGDLANNSADAARWGQIAAIYRPWRDSDGVTAASATDNNCQVTLLDYVGERDVYSELPALQESRIMGITAAKTATTYSFATISAPFRLPAFTIQAATVTSYADATSTQVGTRKTYHSSAEGGFAGRFYSQRNPDGTMTAAVYYFVGGLSWDEYVGGTATKIKPQTTLAGGTWGGGTESDPVWVTPGKSQTRFLSRDVAFRVTSDGVLSAGGYQTLKTNTYSNKGELVQTDTSNGERWTGTLTNGKLVSETKADGTQMQYSYDEFQRLSRTDEGAVVSKVSYDAADRLISTEKAADGVKLTTSTIYNLAGLPARTKDERDLETTYSYTNGGATVTTTLPGGVTRIETRYRDGTVKSVAGTGVIAAYHATVCNPDGSLTTTDYSLRPSDLGAIQAATSAALPAVLSAIPRWQRTTTDWLGRKILEERPAPTGAIFEKRYFYNGLGQLVKTTESGLAATLYTYNGFGELEHSGLDVDGNQALGLGSMDRVQLQTAVFTGSTGMMAQQTDLYVYNQPNNATPFRLGTTVVGLRPFGASRLGAGPYYGEIIGLPATPEMRTLSTDLFGNQTISSRFLDRAAATVTQKVVYPDSTMPELTVATNGMVVSQQTSRGILTTFGYDSLRRPITETDARRGTAKTAYYTTTAGASGDHLVSTSALWANGQVAWREDAAGNRTTYTYSATDGRLVAETDPLNKATYYAYNSRGQMTRQWGPATYPVEYEYNDYGERAKLRTFRDTATDFTAPTWGATAYPSTGGDVTTWTFHAATGLLLAKADAANRTIAYTYDLRGNLKTRTWARNVVTTYNYHPATGEQTGIIYADGTPGLSYDYNRLGQNTSAGQGLGGSALTTLFERCVCGKVTRETFDPTFFGNQILTYKLDSSGVGTKGRTTGMQLGVPNSYALHSDSTYQYDNLGRFAWVVEPDIVASYTYVPNSALIETVNSSVNQFFTYDDHRDHFKSLVTANGRTLASVQYSLDALGRRTAAVNSGELFARYSGGGHHTAYGYNDRSEVTSAQTWTGLNTADTSAASALGGRKFDFAFDPIGNRTTSKNDNRQTDYSANALNQYVSRTVPRAVDVTGLASAAGAVTVNGTAATRVGEYYSSAITAGGTGPAWLNATVAVTPGGNETRNAWVAATPEVYTYDLDGNLTDDGRWTYTWDAENRLTTMETKAAASGVGAPRQFLTFKYDYLGRRIRKTVANWSGSAYVAAVDRKFIYDGWNLIAEYDTLTAFRLARTYVWGLDISRTLQDAGGVHGLLLIRDWATGQSHRTVYDGNGNVLGLVETRTGAITAQYEYSPFGELLRATGSYATSNPFRFSTKYTDSETGLVDYGRRYYNPSQGRFVGRDPIEEKGGTHLHAIVWNNPINKWDYLGMCGGPGQAACQMTPFVVNGGSRGGAAFSSGPTYYGGGNWDTGFDFGGWNTTIDIPAPELPPLDLKRQRTAKCAELFTLQGQAKLMDDSHRPSASGKIDGTDYERLTNDQLTKLGWNLSNAALTNSAGFSASVYRDTQTGQIAVAYRGSEITVSDWVTNLITQPAGISSQYSQAVTVGRQAAAIFGSSVLQLGHSLGGGLAATAALATGTQAVTMNPAGISWLTASNLNLDLNNAPNLVSAWTHQGEILSGVLNPLPLVPDTNGVPHSLPAGAGAGNLGTRHGMASVLGSIADQVTKNGCVF